METTKITVGTTVKAPVEMKREGWQAILDNFKKYTEASSA